MSDEKLTERIAALVAMSSGDGRLDTLTRLTCGRALSLHPLPMEMDWGDGASERESVVAAFTEQLAEHLKKTARQPELIPKDGDVHAVLEFCLQPRDVAP